MFEQLETDGIFNCDNEVDQYCLHQVFLDRINKSLCDFVTSWNNHSISTEGNLTPSQLFYLGQCEESSESDQDSPISLPTPGERVQVPNLRFIPCINLRCQVQAIIQQNT